MEDIPQPASEPYDPGDVVCVYLAPDDPDTRFHGVEVEVVEVYADDLDSETGRNLDRYSYLVRAVDNSDVLEIQFRHSDLVPKEP